MDTLEWVKGLFEKKLRIPIIILIGFMVYFAGNKLGVGKLTNGSPGKLVLQGHNRLTKEEILQILHIDSSTTVEDIDTNEMEVRLKRHPRILSAKVGVRSKDQILVQIEEKKASMVINMNDTLYEVDSGLNILSVDDVRDNELFLISGDFKIQEGKIVSPLLMDVIQSMDSAFSQYPNLKERISEVKLQKDGNLVLYIQYPERLKVYAGTNLDALQIRKLYVSLAYFEEKNIKVKTLDLRGDDAVFQ